MNMKKVMLSQPMKGLTDEEIEKTKLEAAKELSKEGKANVKFI